MNIHSNAFNFKSFLDGQVDPRTGLYGTTISLATLSPQGAIEVSRSIYLQFSMLNDTDVGYGKGWGMSETIFDSASDTPSLRLLSGERIVTDRLPDVGEELILKDRKLKDLVVRRSAEFELHVIYIDGTIEILQFSPHKHLFHLHQIVFENGERFEFHRETGTLVKITNMQTEQEMLVLHYPQGHLTMADTLVHDGRMARKQFNVTRNFELTTVTAPFDRDDAPETLSYYVFEYESFADNVIAITKLETPSGGIEEIYYHPHGHEIDHNRFIPNVTGWTKRPGAGQKNIIRTYTYSSNNFTGFPYNDGFREGVDNLYFVQDGAYEYISEEQVIEEAEEVADVSVLRTTKNTFNNFHLLVSEEVTRGNAKITKEITYNNVPGASFPEQPANLQLPKKIITRYELLGGDDGREEVILSETDEFGNETSRTETSGIRHVMTYYPVEGVPAVEDVPELCPPEPHGQFVRFKKDETIYPAFGELSPKSSSYTYTSLSTLDGNSFYVAIKSHAELNDAVVTDFIYYDDTTDAPLHGRIKGASTTINEFMTRTEFAYELKNNLIIESRKVIGFDNAYLESSRSLSLIGRLLYSITKEDSATLTYEYDVSERMVSELASPNTDSEAARLYTYTFGGPSNQASLETIDALGGQYVTYYDGFGRQISNAEIKKTQEGAEEFTLLKLTYNEFDQVTSEEVVDQTDNGKLSLITSYAYSSWGERSHITRPDGSVYITDYDPISRLKTEGVVGLHPTLSYYNDFNKVVKQVSNRFPGINMIDRTFDGFGRCTFEVLDSAIEVAYEYDIFDRVEVKRYKPDGDSAGNYSRVLRIGYAQHTSDEMAVSQDVNDVRLGSRVYDGVGRLKEQLRGVAGFAATWRYEDGTTLPTESRSPRGVTQNFRYNPELRQLEQITLASGIASEFSYNNVTGLLERSSNSAQFVHLQEHDKYGRVYVDTQVAMNRAEYVSRYDYSTAGRLLRRDSPQDGVENRSYDSVGRLEHIVVGDTFVDYKYDQYGRVASYTAGQGGYEITTEITYEAICERESMRETIVNGESKNFLLTSYYLDGRLHERHNVDLVDEGAEITTERFTYDPNRRLSLYQCDGANHPIDHLGRSIVRQEFAYDSLNNITQVVTVFLDGSRNVSDRLFGLPDPTQLARLTHSNPPSVVTLAYDESGNVISDGVSVYTYDDFERLIAVVQSDRQNFAIYGYDADGRQISRSDPGGRPDVELNYAHGEMVNATQMSRTSKFLRNAQDVLANNRSGSDDDEFNLLDQSASVRGVITEAGQNKRIFYTPYGVSNVGDQGSSSMLVDRVRAAFNGELLDPVTNLYHLGNGRRAYNPELMIFLSPDPLSPFGAGGINAYAYCHGDPINFSDPSGLMPKWLAWLLGLGGLLAGILSFGFALAAIGPVVTAAVVAGVAAGGLGVVSGTLGVAAMGVEAEDERKGWGKRSGVISRLNKASLGFGVASIAAGLVSAGYSAVAAYRTARTSSTINNRMGAIWNVETHNTVTFVPETNRYGAGVGFSVRGGLTEGVRAALGFNDSNIRFMRAFGVIAGGADLVFGITATVTGSGSVADDNSSESDSEPMSKNGASTSTIGAFTDSIASAHGFSSRFDEGASRLRDSALSEMYRSST
ncbi:RHS repeat domain-containing protein [Pseudomonas sp. EMN2]|uniref:RHS repeat domain-containing protein n=1 Tax=Pseudomonas sp. EMN2 TaxID=2615212 RepID=UPI00129C091D|nr:RHS repeat-associated core domain-containing protein [Pseudomonas sp. EMN2]